MSDQAETGRGLLVATMQLAITVGSAAGGILYDASGPVAVFVGGSLVLVVATLAVVVGLRGQSTRVPPEGIGQQLRPFDLKLIDIGQCSALWGRRAPGPEQAALARRLESP